MPNSSSFSYKVWVSYWKVTYLLPSGRVSSIVAVREPSPKLSLVPACIRRPGRARHSQVSPWAWRSSRTSHTAPVGTLTPIKRAGRTLELLTTSTSPAFRYSGRSWKMRCSIVRSSTIRRALSRGSAGSWAISSLGRSYQKSFFNIVLLPFCVDKLAAQCYY